MQRPDQAVGTHKRARARCVIVGLLAVAWLVINPASAEERVLRLFNTNTKEHAVIVFRRNGDLVPAGLRKIDYFLRDWRLGLSIKIDPLLLDVLWQVHKETRSTAYIHINCGYRSDETNEALRRRSSGVAPHRGEKRQAGVGSAREKKRTSRSKRTSKRSS